MVMMVNADINSCMYKNEGKQADGNSDVLTIKTMTGEKLVKQNSGKEKKKVLIIDVRSPEEYKEGHIPHAININVGRF